VVLPAHLVAQQLPDIFGGKSRIIEHTIQNKDGSQECTTYFKSIDPVNIISEMHFSKNSPNLIVQNIVVCRLYTYAQVHHQVLF
jgi:hypothetical protein